jgi:acyl-CoA thioesterase
MAVALSMNITYHHSASPGVLLRAESKEVHLSNKTGTYDIRVTDESDRLIASCQALAYRKSQGLPFLPSGAGQTGGEPS